MGEIYLCLDVGGTQIKAAAVDSEGELRREIRYFPARAKEEQETLLAHFVSIIKEIRVPETEVKGIHLAFPGPFDYEEGICLLQGLDKYDRLYKVNLRQEFAGRMHMAPERIRFINDASAYALGEMGFGHAKGAARAVFICIGTGCGSAFGLDGRLTPPGTSGVPENGYVYDAPFQGGCVDDFISRRGLLTLTKELMGTAMDGKALAERVRSGDEKARACFLCFGCQVRDALLPFLEEFRPEVLCFGGQITRSADLFLPPVEEYCRRAGIRVLVTADTSLRTLQGLTRIP
ncbi:MAG: ROK family protein [Lachnospiraceae bacterium]|jgi:glucokinase|nr:ROK family protein [Lachnospiraceae bacterium]